MTNEHYLEVANECGFGTVTIYSEENKEIVLHTSTPERLAAYTARICAEKDAEIEKLNAALNADWGDGIMQENLKAKQRLSAANAAIDELTKEIERLNALVAMQAEALNEISGMSNVTATDKRFIHILQNLASEALSASSSTAAKWEEQKLLPLQRQVAMLVEKANEALNADNNLPDAISVNYSVQKLEQLLEKQRRAINELRIAVRDTQATAEAFMAEHDAKVLEETSRHPQFIGGSYARILENMAAEKRATKQVKE